MDTAIITSFLAPVLALIMWSLIMWIWLYALRLPALIKMGPDGTSDDVKNPDGQWKKIVPLRIQAPAHNYNHLMEQPTIFYALMFYCALTGNVGGVIPVLAWAYVGLRVVHSLIQSFVGPVLLRFAVFSLATFCLFGMVAAVLL